MALQRQFQAGSIDVQVYGDKKALGQAAAAFVAGLVRNHLARRGTARVIFATGASQYEFLAALVAHTDIDWPNVTAFHLDEYLGLPDTHPGQFPQVPARAVVRPTCPSARCICSTAPPAMPKPNVARYAALLADGPIDLACIGIGEKRPPGL